MFYCNDCKYRNALGHILDIVTLMVRFTPSGGWTLAAVVQMQCVFLHLLRRGNKSETATPSLAAE